MSSQRNTCRGDSRWGVSAWGNGDRYAWINIRHCRTGKGNQELVLPTRYCFVTWLLLREKVCTPPGHLTGVTIARAISYSNPGRWKVFRKPGIGFLVLSARHASRSNLHRSAVQNLSGVTMFFRSGPFVVTRTRGIETTRPQAKLRAGSHGQNSHGCVFIRPRADGGVGQRG